MKKKVLVLGNSYLVVFGFRGELIEELVNEGYEVVVSFPNSVFGNGDETSKKYGCKFVETQIERRKTNPFKDAQLVIKYLQLIKNVKPDIVCAFTVKCDVYGGIACRLAGIPFIANITGLGKALTEGGILKNITAQLYRSGLKKANMVFFQNTSDKKFFEDNNINCKHSDLLPGSGVNLTKYQPLEYPNTEPVIFTYIARIMKAKGIEQFLDAARTLKGQAEFHICGYCEEDYKDIILEEQEEGMVIYHGLVDNIVDYERISHCIVMPSFHPEGISNVLLEAAACARPVITTDRPGCRETVDDGKNGYLVREQDSQDLIKKMRVFMSLSYEQRRAMGLYGREKVTKEFDRQIIVDRYLKIIKELINTKAV